MGRGDDENETNGVKLGALETIGRDSGATSQEPVAGGLGNHRRPAYHRKHQQKGNCDDTAAGKQRAQESRGVGRGFLAEVALSTRGTGKERRAKDDVHRRTTMTETGQELPPEGTPDPVDLAIAREM